MASHKIAWDQPADPGILAGRFVDWVQEGAGSAKDAECKRPSQAQFCGLMQAQVDHALEVYRGDIWDFPFPQNAAQAFFGAASLVRKHRVGLLNNEQMLKQGLGLALY